jgi:Zinc carboxypeptidase
MPYPSTVGQITARMNTLATTYSTICTLVNCAHTTNEGGTGGATGRTVSYLKIGTGTGNGRPRILIVSGMHAREWAPPDAVLTFVEKLLEAYTKSTTIQYSDFTDSGTPPVLYHAFTIPFDPDVKQIIERTELYVLPLANPDGRAYTMPPTKVVGWRKNRRPAASATTCPPLPSSLSADDLKWMSNDPAGVDLNRNFDIAWDINDFYSASLFAAVAATPPTVSLGVSTDACNTRQLFHGPPTASRPSEPETQNVQELITTLKINFYMDVHSASGKILFPWGLAKNQPSTSADPTHSFKNTTLNISGGGSGRDAEASYQEWLPAGSEAQHQTIADLMRDAILDSTGYSASAAAADPNAALARTRSLYPGVAASFVFGGSVPEFDTGTSMDFAFSQQISVVSGSSPPTATASDPVFSLTFECGRHEKWGGFQPHATKLYPKVEREVGMGLAKFMAYAAAWHAPVPTPASTPSTPAPGPSTPPKSGSSTWCFVATACYGSYLHPQVRFLCDLRDNEIKATEFGRRFMSYIEPPYYRFSPAIANFLTRHAVARTMVRLGLVGPGVSVVHACVRLVRRFEKPDRRVRWLLGSILAGGFAALIASASLLFLLGRAVSWLLAR